MGRQHLALTVLKQIGEGAMQHAGAAADQRRGMFPGPDARTRRLVIVSISISIAGRAAGALPALRQFVALAPFVFLSRC